LLPMRVLESRAKSSTWIADTTSWDSEGRESVVGQFPKPLTTKGTKVHEGNACDYKPH
jgi:hypothetical protein